MPTNCGHTFSQSWVFSTKITSLCIHSTTIDHWKSRSFHLRREAISLLRSSLRHPCPWMPLMASLDMGQTEVATDSQGDPVGTVKQPAVRLLLLLYLYLRVMPKSAPRLRLQDQERLLKAHLIYLRKMRPRHRRHRRHRRVPLNARCVG